MPAKSRRAGRKGKYAYQSKKQGGAPQPGAAQAHAAAPGSVPSIAPARATAPRPIKRVADMINPSSIRFSSVPKEIKTIGILAGVILVLLIVLARVLT